MPWLPRHLIKIRASCDWTSLQSSVGRCMGTLASSVLRQSTCLASLSSTWWVCRLTCGPWASCCWRCSPVSPPSQRTRSAGKADVLKLTLPNRGNISGYVTAASDLKYLLKCLFWCTLWGNDLSIMATWLIGLSTFWADACFLPSGEFQQYVLRGVRQHTVPQVQLPSPVPYAPPRCNVLSDGAVRSLTKCPDGYACTAHSWAFETLSENAAMSKHIGFVHGSSNVLKAAMSKQSVCNQHVAHALMRSICIEVSIWLCSFSNWGVVRACQQVKTHLRTFLMTRHS